MCIQHKTQVLGTWSVVTALLVTARTQVGSARRCCFGYALVAAGAWVGGPLFLQITAIYESKEGRPVSSAPTWFYAAR